MYSVSQLVREAQTMKEQRDQQIAELKTLAEQSGETAQHGFEKKVSTYLFMPNYYLSWMFCSEQGELYTQLSFEKISFSQSSSSLNLTTDLY